VPGAPAFDLDFQGGLRLIFKRGSLLLISKRPVCDVGTSEAEGRANGSAWRVGQPLTLIFRVTDPS
jgi:hypothetical protein